VELKFFTEFQSATLPGHHFRVKRISLAQRMRFLSVNHDLMQMLKFLSAAPSLDSRQREELAGLELTLSRKLIEECLSAFNHSGSFEAVNPHFVDWLLEEAPSSLCVEVLSVISQELALSEPLRKKS
jgi:hypothetical protein